MSVALNEAEPSAKKSSTSPILHCRLPQFSPFSWLTAQNSPTKKGTQKNPRSLQIWYLEAVWELLDVKAVEFSSGSAREKRKA